MSESLLSQVSLNDQVISAEEMQIAVDSDHQVSPAKFLPYRKLVGSLDEIEATLEMCGNTFYRLSVLFGTIAAGDDDDTCALAELGADVATACGNNVARIQEELRVVVESAKATIPRALGRLQLPRRRS